VERKDTTMTSNVEHGTVSLSDTSYALTGSGSRAAASLGSDLASLLVDRIVENKSFFAADLQLMLLNFADAVVQGVSQDLSTFSLETVRPQGQSSGLLFEAVCLCFGSTILKQRLRDYLQARMQSLRQPHLQQGNTVEANYRGRGRWFPGRISRVNAGGTFDVDYDDGDKETQVEPSLIRPWRGGNVETRSATIRRLLLGGDIEGTQRSIPGHLTNNHDGTTPVVVNAGTVARHRTVGDATLTVGGDMFRAVTAPLTNMSCTDAVDTFLRVTRLVAPHFTRAVAIARVCEVVSLAQPVLTSAYEYAAETKDEQGNLKTDGLRVAESAAVAAVTYTTSVVTTCSMAAAVPDRVQADSLSGVVGILAITAAKAAIAFAVNKYATQQVRSWFKRYRGYTENQERMRHLHEQLGISETCTAKELAAHYRKRSLQLHPDRAGGHIEEFQKFSAAYEELCELKCDAEFHPTRRTIYAKLAVVADFARGGLSYQNLLPSMDDLEALVSELDAYVSQL
jgi:hypothetical protein